LCIKKNNDNNKDVIIYQDSYQIGSLSFLPVLFWLTVKSARIKFKYSILHNYDLWTYKSTDVN